MLPARARLGNENYCFKASAETFVAIALSIIKLFDIPFMKTSSVTSDIQIIFAQDEPEKGGDIF